MNQDKKVPKLRFPGFNGEWEVRELGKVVKITMGQSPDGKTYSDTPGKYILIQGNADLKDGFVVPKVWTSQITKKADAGDLIMSVRAPAGAIGKTAYDAVIGRGVATIKGNEFIYQNLTKKYIDGYWKRFSAGTTFDSLNTQSVVKAKILVPQEEEQQKIGSFFANLDKTITLQQRKLVSLKKLKKGLLQKMFPKKGQSVPEFRFQEFTGEWVEKRLGALIDYSNGIGHEEYVASQGKYELVTLKSINSEGQLVCSEKFINKEFKTLEKGTLIMMLSEQAKGMLGMTTIIPCDSKYVLNQRVASLKVHSGVDGLFLKNAINNNQTYFEQMGAGTKVQNITRGHVEACVLKIPTLEEQQKIGTFFANLDSTITLQQRKLDSLKKLKKGLLQQMFV